MKKIELLAPVGNQECLYAAIEAGCDAVYLAGYTFGARNFAGNFSEDELIEAIRYSHIYGVKVYVAMNTLVYEEEVEMFMNMIDVLCRNGVDAVIIQDLGMIDLVRQTMPDLEIHASTQMHIHNLEGVQFLEANGVKRVVLSREIPIDEIARIRKQLKEDTELEIFVHGALCFSYSGQCLMSSLIGGRSGNRGTCAQSCRMPYELVSEGSVVKEKGYLLSTKDLFTLPYLGKLIDAGVASLKIEGRMKRPEYVYLTTALYRKAIDSYYQNGSIDVSDEEIKELMKLYNRSFTKGYLFNEENDSIVDSYRPNHRGIPVGHVVAINNDLVTVLLSDTVSQGDGIRVLSEVDSGCTLNKIYMGKNLVNKGEAGQRITFKSKGICSVQDVVVKTSDKKQLDFLNRCIHQKLRKVPIHGTLTVNEGEFLQLMLEDEDGHKITEVSTYEVLGALTSPITKERFIEQMQKLGNTPYQLLEMDVVMSGSVFVQMKELNQLRRDAVESLTEARLERKRLQKKEYEASVCETPVINGVTVQVSSKEDYELVESLGVTDIYVDEVYADDSRVCKRLPRVINHFEEEEGPLLLTELGGVSKYPSMITDHSLNVVNSYTVAFLTNCGVRRVTLSYELNDTQIELLIKRYEQRYHCKPNLERIVYGYPEAMISRYNLLKDYQVHGEHTYLRDLSGNEFLVKMNHDLLTIYHYEPIHLTNYQDYYQMGIASLRVIISSKKDLKILTDQKIYPKEK